VWGLPFQTHSVLLPLLSQCFPVLDEICRRSLNFVRSCIKLFAYCIRLYSCVETDGSSSDLDASPNNLISLASKWQLQVI